MLIVISKDTRKSSSVPETFARLWWLYNLKLPFNYALPLMNILTLTVSYFVIFKVFRFSFLYKNIFARTSWCLAYMSNEKAFGSFYSQKCFEMNFHCFSVNPKRFWWCKWLISNRHLSIITLINPTIPCKELLNYKKVSSPNQIFLFVFIS